MGSLRKSLLHLMLLMLAMVACFVLPSLATSRRAIQESVVSKQSGFKVALKHVDSGKNLTGLERLQRALTRGQHRLDRLTNMVMATASEVEAEASVHAGKGEFLMELSIGTPAERFLAIMDTGSDLIWTQCKPCSKCFNQTTPIFDPEKSSSFSLLPCTSHLCAALPIPQCSATGCEYLYTYGDYSFTQGIMATETFTLGDGGASDGVAFQKVGFGCGHDSEGGGFPQGAGLVGLGRGPLSLVSQLGVSEFSYCLTSIDDTKTSKLLFGPQATGNTSSGVVTVPLIKNPSQPSFYYLPIEGISVGETRLPINESTFKLQANGNGGLVIDSGTTITYLETKAFDLVKKEFISQTKLSVDKSGTVGLELCFTLPSGESHFDVPKLVFHFQGADLDLPADNYMISDSSLGLVCLAMGSSSGMSILGNVQQQNMMVVHNLAKETLSFIPTQCDRL